MRTKIYQINGERDKNKVKFKNLDELNKGQDILQVDSSIYDEVLNAEIEETNLEEIFRKFNTEGHPLFRGHSLSVSDVVVNDYGAFYCNSVGFEKTDFDESLTHKPDNLMRIVYVEPHKPPYVSEIENTLEAKQKAVGGLIEPLDIDDEVCLIGNEEAKLIGLEGNRRIWGGDTIIAGNFFICGVQGEEFRGLTDKEVMKYMDLFAEPEDISQDEVESNTGFVLYSF